MKFLKSFPFYTFLLALFFCLHGLAENFGFISFLQTLKVFSLVFLGILMLFLTLFLATKKIHFSGLLTFYFSICYFFFEVLKKIFANVAFLKSYTFLLPFLISIAVVIFFVRKNKEKHNQKVSFFLNILLICYCIYDVALVVIASNQKSTNTFKGINFNYKAVLKKPNVYYLVFDEYAGYNTLNDSLHFKNENLYNFLKGNNFKEIDTKANYFFTPFSISSTINMQYIANVNGKHIVTAKQIQKRTAEIKNGLVFNIFDSLGYTVKSFSFFDVLQNKNVGGSDFLIGHERILTNKMFHNQFLKDIAWRFVMDAKKPNVFHKLLLKDLPEYNAMVEKGLLNNINKTKPQFLYAHFFMPHNPYLTDSAGVKISFEKIYTTKTPLQEDEAYVGYLKYCNKKIIQYCNTIIQNDSTAIIIISSDHGRKEYASFENNSQAPFNNICFVYPSVFKDSPTVATSNVNLFRLVFNNFFSQNLPILSDSTFYLEDIKD